MSRVADRVIATPEELLAVREGDMELALTIMERVSGLIADVPFELILREPMEFDAKVPLARDLLGRIMEDLTTQLPNGEAARVVADLNRAYAWLNAIEQHHNEGGGL